MSQLDLQLYFIYSQEMTSKKACKLRQEGLQKITKQIELLRSELQHLHKNQEQLHREQD